MGAGLLILAIGYAIYRLMTRDRTGLAMDPSSDCDEIEYHVSSVHHSEFVAPGFTSSSGSLNVSDEARLM
jgi:hypothetical protein